MVKVKIKSLTYKLIIWLHLLPTLTTSFFNDLNIITEIFEIERQSHIRHDIVFCGDFVNQQVSHTFAESFQIALRSEKWILSAADGLLNSISEEDGNSIIFFIVPSTEENLNRIVEIVSRSDSTLNETQIKAKRSFVLSWPNQVSSDDQRVVEILQNSKKYTDPIKLMQINEEVYILVWTQDPLTNEIQLHEIIEIYGIYRQLAVIKNLEILNAGFDNRTISNQLNTIELGRISDRRSNFHGLKFKAVAQVSEPGEHDTFYDAEVTVRNDTGTVQFLRGSSFNVLVDFLMLLNFTYEAIWGEGWTTENENKTGLLGVGGQVLRHDADFCVSASTMEVYRGKYISFLHPIALERSYVFFRQPSITAARNIFMMPFQSKLWFSVLVVWLVIMVCGTVVAYRRTDLGHVGTGRMYSRLSPRQQQFHYYDVQIWTIGSACQQGWFGSPLRLSMRIIFFTSLLSNLMIYAYYTAAFVAAISAPITPVTKFEDFSKNQMSILVNPDNTQFVASFASSEAERVKIIESSSKLFNGGDEDAVYKVVNGKSKYAAIIAQDSFFGQGLLNYTIQELCEIDKLTGKRESKVNDAQMLRRGSPYREMFSHKTVMLIERGLTERYWLGYEMETQIRCLANAVPSFELEMLDCYSAFLILLAGLLLALLELVVERNHHKGLKALSASTGHYCCWNPFNK